MFRIEKIILLFDDNDLTQKLIKDFALWGIPLRVLQERSAAELCLDESAEPGELMMMCTQKQELLRDVGCLRAKSPTLGIVVLRMDGLVSPVHSGFLMLAGAIFVWINERKAWKFWRAFKPCADVIWL